MYTYEYPRPALTVDCVIFGWDNEKLKVLLIERAEDPYKGCWAFPGGFVEMDETLDTAAKRELQEETGVENMYLEQLYTFGKVNRDPRGRVVSVAYFALVKLSDYKVEAGSDAKKAEWIAIDQIPKLAFDHEDIFNTAIQRLRNKIRYQPVGFELLPQKFTLTELQSLYESILGKKLDKRNFRKKILGMKVIVDCVERQKGVPHRAAKLYSFDRKAYLEAQAEGFTFEL